MSKLLGPLGALMLQVSPPATQAAAAAVTAHVVFNDLSVPFFGVPLTVIAMAAGGALASFAYGDPIKSRTKLYTLAAANTFLASVAVAVFPAMLGWEWANPKIAPALAALIAAAARWFVPAIVEAVPELVRKIFRLDKKEKQDG